MNFKEFKLKLKNELKDIAVIIRKLKGERKQHEFGRPPGLWGEQQDFRIKHIAYCMLRGTPYNKIESKHRNPKDYINKMCKDRAFKLHGLYKDQLGVMDNEVICIDA